MKTLLRLVVLLVLAACRRSGELGGAVDIDGWPAAPEVRHRIVLIGDGGELCPAWSREDQCEGGRDPLLDAARAAVLAGPASSSVVWLGDNVYWWGANGKGDGFAENALKRQVGVARDPRDVTFLPGNHDWGHLPRLSRVRIDAQRYIVEGLSARVRAFPGEGGLEDLVVEREPVANDRLTVLYLDTERLLKMRNLRDAALQRVRDALAEGRPTLILAHHPVVTDGSHARGNSTVCHLEDLDADCYDSWNDALVATLSAAKKPAFLVGGHDHYIQLRRVVPGWTGWQLVSGASAKSECGPFCRAGALPTLHTPFDGPGFGILDVLDGGYRLTVVRLVKQPEQEGCEPILDGWSACLTDAGDPFAGSL